MLCMLTHFLELLTQIFWHTNVSHEPTGGILIYVLLEKHYMHMPW